MRMGKFTRIIGFLAVFTLFAGIAQAQWWDAKWQYRKKVTFDTTSKGANVSDNIAEVPVLVRLHAGNFTFDNAKPDGSDIRFMGSDDKTPLKYHVEKFDPKQGIALFWVKVPQIAGNAAQDSVWLYYGNSSVQAGADAGGTYDTAQVAVFHFDEKDGTPKDATAYGNHASEFTGKLGTPAVIGNGAAFNGSSDKLVIKRAPSLNFSKGFSFSTWVKIAAAQGDARLFSWDDGKQAIVVGLDNGAAYARVGQAATGKAQPLTPQTWHHLAVTAEPGKKLTVYLDGKEAAVASMSAAMPSPAAEMAVGAALKGGNFFAGELDEVQIASIARPASWVGAAFAGQGQDGKLTAYLQEESGKGGGEDVTIHLMKVVARTITLDGWVIIGILGVMSLLSVFVFVNKTMALRKAKRDNKAFAEVFGAQTGFVQIPEEEDDYENSSLYRVYQAGTEELRKWLGKGHSVSELANIPDVAFNAFRAALDRTSMQETRRLSAGLSILVMGISAGPFLGLLGTVWGVMNTFASLAEAGEANLSAIAPGVASALACTLAGLLVAIPALFANNFLTANIKDMNADMNMFVDEFILKLEAEGGDKQ